MCLDCGYFLYVFCLKLKRSAVYPNNVLSIVMVAFEKYLIKIQKNNSKYVSYVVILEKNPHTFKMQD